MLVLSLESISDLNSFIQENSKLDLNQSICLLTLFFPGSSPKEFIKLIYSRSIRTAGVELVGHTSRPRPAVFSFPGMFSVQHGRSKKAEAMEGGPDTPHAIKTEGMGLKHTRKSDCWPRRLRFDSGPRGSISITAASADNSPVNGTSATVFRSMSRVRARPPGIPCDGG